MCDKWYNRVKCGDIPHRERRCCICGEPGGWYMGGDYVAPPREEPHCLGWWARYYCRLHYDIMCELQ